MTNKYTHIYIRKTDTPAELIKQENDNHVTNFATICRVAEVSRAVYLAVRFVARYRWYLHVRDSMSLSLRSHKYRKCAEIRAAWASDFGPETHPEIAIPAPGTEWRAFNGPASVLISYSSSTFETWV
jgi:hypothetical protein